MNQWRSDGWCKLCLAPVVAWDRHGASREHQSIKLFYGSLSRKQRWSPLHILSQPGLSHTMHRYHAFIDAEDRRRREKLLSCISFLQRKGLVDRQLRPQQEHVCHGINILKELAGPILLSLVPGGSVGEYSAFLQMAICAYNMETLWDLAQLECLIPTRLDRKLGFQEKGNRVQTIVGSVRDVSLDAIGSCPSDTECAITHAIATFVVRCIVLELVYIRSIEYVIKALNAWAREQTAGGHAEKRVQLRNDSGKLLGYLKAVMEADLWASVPLMPSEFLAPRVGL